MIRMTVVRKNKDLTQGALATRLGVSQQYISGIETRGEIPTRRQLKRIAAILEWTDDPMKLLEQIIC